MSPKIKLTSREYAEFIESRLIKVGLTVDLLFPNEEVPLGRVLANISGRGTLFAIVVNMTNEEHRSLTLNILYGQPQGELLHQLFYNFMLNNWFKIYGIAEKSILLARLVSD